jgi:Zn ribbon nucleic-acid-binding protein
MELSGHLQATVNDRRTPVNHKTAGWVNSSVNTKICVTCGNENTVPPSSSLHRSHNTDYATSAPNKH